MSLGPLVLLASFLFENDNLVSASMTHHGRLDARLANLGIFTFTDEERFDIDLAALFLVD